MQRLFRIFAFDLGRHCLAQRRRPAVEWGRYFHVAGGQPCVSKRQETRESIQQLRHGLAGCLASRRFAQGLRKWKTRHFGRNDGNSILELALVANAVATEQTLFVSGQIMGNCENASPRTGFSGSVIINMDS